METRGQHGVLLTGRAIAHHYQLEVVTRETGFGEGDVFGNRIILAVAFSGCEGRKRRTPPVAFTKSKLLT